MSFVKEFKEFATKGNMVDLAIGVIIGTAFGKVISSLVADIIMPPIGWLLGKVDFSQLSLKFDASGGSAQPVEIKYGLFINTLIDFLIVSLVIFLMIKLMNRWRQAKATAPATKTCPECLMEIPDKAKKCGHCCSFVP